MDEHRGEKLEDVESVRLEADFFEEDVLTGRLQLRTQVVPGLKIRIVRSDDGVRREGEVKPLVHRLAQQQRVPLQDLEGVLALNREKPFVEGIDLPDLATQDDPRDDPDDGVDSDQAQGDQGEPADPGLASDWG